MIGDLLAQRYEIRAHLDDGFSVVKIKIGGASLVEDMKRIEAVLKVVAPNERDQVAGRAMVVRKFKPLMIEAVVRGYIIGSGWKDYQKTGKVCGIKLPAGLKEAEQLPQVIFTPATKAPAGEHDENIDFAAAEKIVGAELAAKVRF